MRIIKLIFFMILVMPLMLLLSGCFDDSILDAIKSEKDFIAPFTVTLPENQAKRTTYFEIADTGNTFYLRDGDDSTYVNIPAERSFTPRPNVNLDGDDVLDDNVTGLTWTKCTSDGFNSMKTNDGCIENSVEMSWSQAVQTCEELDYAGYFDWRLPTLPELLTLVKVGSTTHFADLDNFPDTKIGLNDAYWTYTSKLTISTSTMDVADYGWIIYFGLGGYLDGQITNYIKKLDYNSSTGVTTPAKAYVKCVRGGID